MVCARCTWVVREELEKIHLQVLHIELGKAQIITESELLDINLIETRLYENGFELIKDKWQELSEQIKVLIVKLVHHNWITFFTIEVSKYLLKTDAAWVDMGVTGSLYVPDEMLKSITAIH